ncbi:glycosyl hydrolase [Legionella geestiana]|uniref:beta-N-acetylhexosaminidase n=1 Tax=Legionella geestiana TaxID=45065 RepID=A0A0W0TJX9_9GAMM|nr:glycoside hydrolase family 3 N-terminal domain-containing protein [Legionella geestiana]KTC95870.1 glycosyl hydrolase [Legionella geestiana]QBS13281.1 glycoside hydrolase family 3 protein [Legionella geestiana]QDQ40871.1 glycoside hydrolase family 3 protein [Legionella geestiana]STX54192.1 beta-N-acetylhexosaminidase [Legionella geestiana]
MSGLRHKIAQMLIMGFEGTHIDADSPVSRWLCEEGLGGVLLFDKNLHTGTFGKNLRDRTQIRALNTTLQALSQEGPGAGMPLLIAVDYEGGAVDRLRHIPGCPPTLDARTLAALSEDEQHRAIETMANTLASLGFTLNFAPVVDLALTHDEGIIGKLGRSYSACPEEVLTVARRFVKVFERLGIKTAFKHFPGHGSAAGDTHLGCVDVTESFQPDELVPYKSLGATDGDPSMVMTAHVINRRLDASGLPATLSRPMLTGLLRESFGFQGVIVSDDLQMHAIAHHYTLEDALTMTVNAGADMLIFGNQWGEISATAVIDALEGLVQSGRVDAARIEDAFKRVCALKQTLQPV